MTLTVPVRTARSRTARPSNGRAQAKSPQPSRSVQLSPLRACCLPLLFALGLVGLGFLDSVRHSPPLFWSFVGAAVALFGWTVVLFRSAVSQGRTFALHISLRKQHYLQALAQGSVFLYWGWYWPQVYESAHLIAAQLLFAYGVDMLLVWSRRDAYTLGFGPFPVVFSINLFLWFKPEWFYLQFLMVAIGFAAKEFIQWEKDGRITHIFNPSAFTLALVSIALLLSGRSDITWGANIAVTQFYPPHMYLMLFLVGLPGQLLFGVASMTMAAVVATYAFGLLYFAATGVYFFYDSYIPIAVFLGMHLLFTDPSTSPRTELGRLIFGALYGLSTVVLYQLLRSAGLPTFYDKLLQVPLLNLSIKLIDRVARSKPLTMFDPAALGRSLTPQHRNLAYAVVWTLVFAMIGAARGVGDGHPGQWLPFWQQACAEGRHSACGFSRPGIRSLLGRLGLGVQRSRRFVRLRLSSSNEDGNGGVLTAVVGSFERGCELAFKPACENLRRALTASGPPASASPTVADYPIVLRGAKQAVTDRRPSALYALACRQGWSNTCGANAVSQRN